MTDTATDDGPIGYYVVNTENVYDLWDGKLHTTSGEALESLTDPLDKTCIRPGDRWVVVECWPVEGIEAVTL